LPAIFLATESAFLAVLFGFNLLGEFQRALDPALKTYKQPATLRFKVFTCGAILGRSGHHLVLHMFQKLRRLLQSKTALQQPLTLASANFSEVRSPQ
jgi:hypothetical protein